MLNTPNLSLPYIDVNAAQREVVHNEAIRGLDALVQLAVLDRDLTAPPGSPADGQRWLVAASPTGAWSGHAADIAGWQDGAWRFYAPRTGWLAYVVDEGVLLGWNGSAWVDALSLLTTIQNVALFGVGTTADATNPFSAKLNNALWVAKAVSEGGDGDLRYKISKEGAGNTLSVLMQTNFSGRAELGLTGDDDFHLKVSPDGSAWYDGLTVSKSSGDVIASAIGIGAAPSVPFQVSKSASSSWIAGMANTHATAGNKVMVMGVGPNGGDSSSVFLDFYDAGFNTKYGSITRASSTQVAYNTTSDVRSKSHFNASGIDWGDVIDRLWVGDFRLRGQDQFTLGIVAQWAHPIFPQAVTRPFDDDELWEADYSKLAPLALWGVKDTRTKLATIDRLLTSQQQCLAGCIETIERLTDELAALRSEVNIGNAAGARPLKQRLRHGQRASDQAAAMLCACHRDACC
jgi:hypothetical protein